MKVKNGALCLGQVMPSSEAVGFKKKKKKGQLILQDLPLLPLWWKDWCILVGGTLPTHTVCYQKQTTAEEMSDDSQTTWQIKAKVWENYTQVTVLTV